MTIAIINGVMIVFFLVLALLELIVGNKELTVIFGLLILSSIYFLEIKVILLTELVKEKLANKNDEVGHKEKL